MRIYFSIFIFFIGLSGWSQDDESIQWSPQHRLSWTDFRGKPLKTAYAAATTASGISYQFSTMETDGKYELDYTVTTYFYPTKSWYQPEVCDEVILSHEQLHFDISELFSRKMRKLLTEANFTKKDKAEVKAMYRRIIKELEDFQNLYDHETNFSRDRKQQFIWNKKIAEALQNSEFP
jgi:hypothetical protein